MPPIPQTTMNRFPANAAFEGDLYSPLQDSKVESKACAQAAGIYAGRFVTRNADEACERPNASADITGGVGMGFALRDKSKFAAGTDPLYANTETVPVLTDGLLWVQCETACAYGGAVFVRFTTALAGGDADKDLGNVRNDVAAGAAVALPGAFFRSTLSGAGLALVEYKRQT